MTNRRSFLSATATLPLATFSSHLLAQTGDKDMTSNSAPAHLSANPASAFATQAWDSRNRIDMGRYTVERVSFQCDGIEIVGNLFIPSGVGKKPGVVMTGPVAYIKEQAPIQYASRLAKEGFATLIYDPRCHGESAGMPRRFESRKAKVEDIEAAVGFITTCTEVDASRIHVLGFWGHRIDAQLKRLDKPTLMVHSDRAASGPKIPRELFEVIATKDKHAVWLEGRNQIQFYQDPLTIDMVVPHLTRHFQKHSA